MINTLLDQLQQTRQNMLTLLAQHSFEQLNLIPVSFNNNLIWNAAHVLVTQQLLCYRLSGIKGYIDDSIIESYRKGTRPEKVVSDGFIIEMKEQLVYTGDKIREDYHKDIFKEYKSYLTSFGTEITSIEDAIAFNNIHEGMHLGTMMAMRKLV
ncbi:MAG: DinB family protein [Bacteroidia bacterium]|nr:DinB family protein [Bacteroidia bacterium]